MPRHSLIEYLGEYRRHGRDIAFAQRSGYRMVRWSYSDVAGVAAQFARELEAEELNRAIGSCFGDATQRNGLPHSSVASFEARLPFRWIKEPRRDFAGRVGTASGRKAVRGGLRALALAVQDNL